MSIFKKIGVIVVALAMTGCVEFCKVLNDVLPVLVKVETVLSVAAPFFGPALATEYKGLSSAVDLLAEPALDACKKDAPIDANTRDAITAVSAEIAFYRDHKQDVARAMAAARASGGARALVVMPTDDEVDGALKKLREVR